MSDMEQEHARLAYQQLPVGLNILHLVSVVLDSSLVQLLLNPMQGGGEVKKIIKIIVPI